MHGTISECRQNTWNHNTENISLLFRGGSRRSTIDVCIVDFIYRMFHERIVDVFHPRSRVYERELTSYTFRESRSTANRGLAGLRGVL